MRFVVGVTSVVCAVGAAVLAFKGAEGWGWFLFVALITARQFEVVLRREEPKDQ